MMSGKEEGGVAGHKISADSTQIVGQRCPLQMLCVCFVRLKVTQLIQQDDLTLDSCGVSGTSQFMENQARCLCARPAQRTRRIWVNSACVSVRGFLEVVGVFRCSQIGRGSLVKAGK